MLNLVKAAAITLVAVGTVAAGSAQAGQFRFNNGGQEKAIIIVGGAPQEKSIIVVGGKGGDPLPQQQPRIKFQSRFLYNSLNPQPLPPKENW